MRLPYRLQSSHSMREDTFQSVYVPLLKLAMNFSTVKYIVFLIYCIRSMQEHLSLPTYCRDASAKFSCSSSSCFWLHKIVLNLPIFVIRGSIFVEQCAYLLVLFFISCSLFLYAIHLVKQETDLKIRYRAILTIPSLLFELAFCFLSYYATITAIVNYSQTATSNPEFYSTAFVIFAFIISVFYALLLVIHFATLYYIMILPIIPLTIFNYSNANFSKYGQRYGDDRSVNYEPLSVPLMRDTYEMSVNNWQAANDTRGTVSSYSQIRSWNNTVRSTNTLRNREQLRVEEDDYLEVV